MSDGEAPELAAGVVELDYVEERGPGIAELPPGPSPGAEQGVPEPLALPGWDQETVETFLRGTGAGVHQLAGVAERDWHMTQADLQRIAPPLTRILNRYEPTLRASEYADPILLAHGMALYGWRSMIERQRAIRDARLAGIAGTGYEAGPEPELPEEQESLGEQDFAEADHQPYFPESPKARQA